MTRLDRYLLAETLPALVFGLLLYSSLAVVSVTIPRLQWIVGTPLLDVLGWLALQLPTALVQTLPIALVLAILLAFGSLASSNELVAMQAGAVPFRRITAVFVALGLICALSALVLNQWVLPTTNARVGSVYWELTSGRSGLFRLAGQGVPIQGFTLTFDRAVGDTAIREVRIERWQGRTLQVLFAERGEFVEDGLRLYGYRNLGLDLDALDASGLEPQERLERLVRVETRAPTPEASLLLTTGASVDELITDFSGGGFEDTRSISEAWRDAGDPDLTARDRLRAAILFHRKLAEPFANLSLILAALPLSILYARSRSVAFGLSLVVTLVWYLLLTGGQLFAQTGVLPTWVGMWLGNLTLAGFGSWLLLSRTTLR